MKRKIYLAAAISSLISMTSLAQYPTNGLVEYYSFNDVLTGENGTPETDFVAAVSTNFTDGSYNSSSHRVYSKASVDNALITNDNITNFPIGNNDFTICYWLKINDNSTASIFNYIGSQTPGPDGGNTTSGIDLNGIYMSYDNNAFYIGSVVMGSYYDGALPWNYDSNWHHIALTHTAGNTSVFIDGALVGTNTAATFGTINHPNSTLRIGLSPGGGDYGVFDIDEFLIYNRVVSTTEIISIKNGNGLSVGVDENELTQLSLYPNPAENEIQVSNLTGEFNYEIVSMAGQILAAGKSTSNQTIATEALSNGVYFIKIQQNNATQTIKFVKE